MLYLKGVRILMFQLSGFYYKTLLEGTLGVSGKADPSRRGLALLEEVEAPARKQAAGASLKGLGFRVRAPLRAPLGIKG